MNRPSNYDSVKDEGKFEAIKPGGHKNTLRIVEEATSKNGNQMLIISFDTSAEDKQPSLYAKKFLSDKKSNPDPKWRGKMWLVTDENSKFGTANLKRFVTAIEESNPGFHVPWGDGFCDSLVGKKIGIVFREEEYEKQDGGIGVSAKPYKFCNYNEAFNQPIPNRKTLGKKSTPGKPSYAQASTEEFMSVDNLDDIGLPFK